MNRRDEIRARLNAATPGPWATMEPRPRFITCPTVEHVAIDEADWGEEVGNIMQLVMVSDTRAWRYADVRLVAHAPADLRDLLAVVDTVWDAHADHADQSYRKTCATCAALDRLDTGGHR